MMQIHAMTYATRIQKALSSCPPPSRPRTRRESAYGTRGRDVLEKLLYLRGDKERLKEYRVIGSYIYSVPTLAENITPDTKKVYKHSLEKNNPPTKIGFMAHNV